MLAVTPGGAETVHRDDGSFVVVFTWEPESIFGIDLRNGCLVLHEPRRKGYRPPLDALQGLEYRRENRSLTVRVAGAEGVRSVRFSTLEPPAWGELARFVRTHLGGSVPLRKR